MCIGSGAVVTLMPKDKGRDDVPCTRDAVLGCARGAGELSPCPSPIATIIVNSTFNDQSALAFAVIRAPTMFSGVIGTVHDWLE